MQVERAKTNVALIGGRWTGKTSVGIVLAHELRMEHVDTDMLVEEAAGKSTIRIFKEDGEVAFRLREIFAVIDASDMSNVVISCGGGVVLNQVNIEILRATSSIVLLTADLPTMLRRAEGGTHERPSLTGKRSATDEIAEIMELRRPLYKKYADLEVDTSELSIAEVVAIVSFGLTLSTT